MKTIPPALLEHYASGGMTLARLWRIERTDGEVFGFTDHDRTIVFAGVTYLPSGSFDASAISTRSELNVDNLEAKGLLATDGVTVADIEAGRWDGAWVEIREVNWADLTMGANILRVGQVGQLQRGVGMYTAEARGLMLYLQNIIGRGAHLSCDATLGDARCTVDLDALTVSATVTGVTTRREFVASALAQAEDYFTGGSITFTGGLNVGLLCEIKKHDTGGAFTTHLPFPYDVAPGDTFDVAPGCDKVLATCRDTYDNVVNFRGFPHIPGQDKVLLVGGQ